MVGQKVVNERWQKFVQWIQGSRRSRGRMVISGKGAKQIGIMCPSSEMYERFIPILKLKKESGS